MKSACLLLSLLAAGGVAHAADMQSEADHAKSIAEIKAVIATFHDAVVDKQKERFVDLFLNQHIPWLGVFDDRAWQKVRAQQPKWGKAIPYANDTYLSFIDDVTGAKARIEEKMWNVDVSTDGEIATMNCDYSYHVGDYKQNWGKESWHLLHTEEGWKISSVIYSVTFNPEPRKPA